jgi:hypothetical protein
MLVQGRAQQLPGVLWNTKHLAVFVCGCADGCYVVLLEDVCTGKLVSALPLTLLMLDLH